ncbi:serine/threonine protein kinase [Actinomadura sp. NAK00032]|uniref:protein kinase domain-containing protein n=1 Tax=Actinomadura sp. NAK00032 TaxID=2742128 RepID=UPI00159035A3|nr:protein kinase [Actinomadura sp. NAK00032]QKW32709.1 serine/threonine protein kinase [Actinomadura sp. NAK00032]
MKPLQPGDPRRVGPYRLEGRLGGGGMGLVFLGRSQGGRPVAIKVVRPELADDAGFRRRFTNEVEAARRVGGFYTAQVVDADTMAHPPWLATAFIPGLSLEQAVRGHGPLPDDALSALGAGLAEGLAAIHDAGLVHRDLKPGNIILAADGPRVIDFGIARALDDAHTSTVALGTPGYMSPEQARGLEVGPPSDVFALGAVLTFAATERGPFGTGPAGTIVYRIVHESPDLARLPSHLTGLISDCLAKDPGRRPGLTEILDHFADASKATLIMPNGLLPEAGDPAAHSAADGRIEVFMRDADDRVRHVWQVARDGGWSNWDDMSGYRFDASDGPLEVAGDPAAHNAADGRIELFVRGTDGHMWHAWQVARDGNWSNWDDMSGYRTLASDGPLEVAGDPTAHSSADGRIEVFVRGADGRLWHAWQVARDGNWSNWQDLGQHRPLPDGDVLTVAGDPAAHASADGRIEVFVRGVDSHLWHLWQVVRDGDWSDWQDLSRHRPLPDGDVLTVAGDPAAHNAADGRIEVFVRGVDGHLWHVWQVARDGNWSNWEDLSRHRPLPDGDLLTVAGDPAAHNAADGRIEVFVRGADGHLWHLWQVARDGGWSNWENLSRHRPLPNGDLLTVVGDPAAHGSADGRIEVFVRGADGHLWHLWQVVRDGDWSDWEDFGPYHPAPTGMPG